MTEAIAVMVTSACLNFSGNGHEACSKVIEATAKQTGIEQTVEITQKYVENEANKKAKLLIGKPGIDAVGSGIFIAKTLAEKSVKFDAPTFGICDKITNEISVDKYSLQMRWGF